ncbi:hypothetical protein [Moorella sulfitireducens (nom. illeg.)]|uniref:hypothetical protein n=1 Tax=Neomoorella sulfitireducens TaxID=2972948 RepID=UPI0021ABD36F|nr:hypothetical protein [Moorella sulfitireducens]
MPAEHQITASDRAVALFFCPEDGPLEIRNPALNARRGLLLTMITDVYRQNLTKYDSIKAKNDKAVTTANYERRQTA